MDPTIESPMVLIPPPKDLTEQDTYALNLIRRLGKTLATKSCNRYIDQQILKCDKSVRRIQTGRYEIFVDSAADKGSACFDKILKRNHYPADTTQTILQFASRQARRDERMMGTNYKFGNFSIIFTYGTVEKQAPHIDLLKPNWQFGMTLTDNCPGTLVYLVDETIETVDNVVKLWNEVSGGDTTVPPILIKAFQQSQLATQLVKDFGNVLMPEQQMTEVPIDGTLSTGSLLSLPGSIVHAGPDANDARGVLFFSGWPEDGTVAEYHPDTQYTAVFLCGQLVLILWRYPGMGFKERLFLLQVLARYMWQSSVKRTWSFHFEAGPFRSFMEELEEKDSLSPGNLDILLKKAAENESLCFFNIQGDFNVVSADNLHTMWEKKDLEIEVYRRNMDGKILIKFLNESEESVAWEGSQPEDDYRLKMSVDNVKFNGRNGILVDTDGEEIKCFCTTKSRPATDTPDSTTNKKQKSLFNSF